MVRIVPCFRDWTDPVPEAASSLPTRAHEEREHATVAGYLEAGASFATSRGSEVTGKVFAGKEAAGIRQDA